MNIDLVVHRQLNARDILVVGDKWKELYDFFQEGVKKYGLYFYTYKKSPMPFYVGKCTAKSFNILGSRAASSAQPCGWRCASIRRTSGRCRRRAAGHRAAPCRS